ncbi:MAG: carboxyl transferase domain-containing protein [Acidimicrobiales bacterium]
MVNERPVTRLLIANRGEIACRIAAGAADLGIETVAVAPDDDAGSRHTQVTDRFVALEGRGPAAYLDIDQLVAVAVAEECDAVHPGYGFLSENSAFATAVEAAGLRFVGPTPAQLAALGDKAEARRIAAEVGVPVLPASEVLADADEAAAFLADHGAMVLKAVSGGGGRGMRIVTDPADVAAALERCRSEALGAFGDDAVYAERLVGDARHVEVQIVGDGSGAVVHLHERECTLQRRHQKVVEYAPSPTLDRALADRLAEWSVSLGAALDYRGVGTVEFLVDRGSGDAFFIEANARLQVEHTVTEEITGVDLVQTQLGIVAGGTLAEVGLAETPTRRGQAVQLRVNLETMEVDGSTRPAGGTLTRFEPPTGPGVRVDTYGAQGYTTSPAYDSLLAKVIVHGRDHAETLVRAARAVDRFALDGPASNLGFLAALLADEAVAANDVSTTFIAANAERLAADAAAWTGPAGSTATAATSAPVGDLAPGTIAAPLQGTVVTIDVAPGDAVPAGAQLLVMEAMKMEHVVVAAHSGVVGAIAVAPGDAVFEGHGLLVLDAAEVAGDEAAGSAEVDLDHVRADLAEVNERHGFGFDENRAEAVAKRHAKGKRTARENIADLVDDGTFMEWGPLVVAAQRKRRSLPELIEKTPGDGLVGGIGSVNGDAFGEDDAQCVVMTYDYMVLAGTQGHQNHRKKDRLFELAQELRLPTILFAEGGGGRPGDTDGVGVAGLDCMAFRLWGELSGLVPLVGINAGYCFAGNAALLGCCDVVIATRDSNLGMGGPAMIEGGGLGVFHPTEIGPSDVQSANGVIDILVDDEEEAVRVAKQYLAYFQGRTDDWEAHDQRRLRHVIPENRLRIYDVREVIDLLFDVDSVLELRADFGLGMITALARIEGRPVGVVANNPAHLAGAIDADGADKAARFLQLCDAFDLPVVNLCDTPGIMVGPEAEKTALVRHASRLFVVGASVEVPMCTIVLRKGYGLGAQAMAAGSFKSPVFTVAWPTGEFGGMGLEGAVQLGYRNELAAIEDPEERERTYQEMVDRMYTVGKAVSMADHFEIDDVIDPAESRRVILTMLRAAPAPLPRSGKKRPAIDTW